jgi:hypothetical protein
VRGWMAFVVPFVAVIAFAGVGWGAAQTVGWSDPGPLHDIAFEELHDGAVHVRLDGMAHYASTITQKMPGSLFTEEQTFYVFGVFPKDDTSSRSIPLLVRTSRPPERMVSFEVMTLEGTLGQIDTRLLPPSTEAMLSARTEYWFADEMKVLTVERIFSEDGV